MSEARNYLDELLGQGATEYLQKTRVVEMADIKRETIMTSSRYRRSMPLIISLASSLGRYLWQNAYQMGGKWFSETWRYGLLEIEPIGDGRLMQVHGMEVV